MKNQTNILVLLMGAALFAFNSCNGRACGCLPPATQTFKLALLNSDSMSLHLQAKFNLDSTQYLDLQNNKFVKSTWEYNGKSLKNDLEIFRDTLFFHYYFPEDKDIDTTIYLTLLPGDVDTLSYSYSIFENKNPESFMIFNRDTFQLDPYSSNYNLQYFKK